MSASATGFGEEETIVAVATPPGRGGIGVVRLSGARARAIAEPLLRMRGEWAAGAARFGEVLGEAGEVLDEAVMTWFRAPRSYTSEDVVEISVHGAPVLLDYVLRRCCAGGARLAEPGEFTRRAFLSGRMDLTQAEAVHDLIAASTLEQARVAARQLGGGLSRVVGPIKERLVGLIAALEAGIDFAEDDVEVMPRGEIVGRITALQGEVGGLAGTFGYGRVVRDGFRLAIVGRPNAGKSSLFNRLLERERSIVTAVAGTTRDTVSERVSIGGIPVELVDTAGLRKVPAGLEGEAERIGIGRSREAMADADAVLLVVDASLDASPDASQEAKLDAGLGFDAWAEDREEFARLAQLRGEEPLVVLNKSDLGAGLEWAGAERTSALTGAGIAELRGAILARLGAPAGEAAMVTNMRQHGALVEAGEALGKAAKAAGAGVPHEMVLLDLYGGLRALDELTGVTTAEDVLGAVFSSFCIGK